MYDLENDPHELKNLIGHNLFREQYRALAEEMKTRLLDWLERVHSSQLDEVQRQPVIR